MKRAVLHAALAASLLCSAGAARAADFIFSFSSDLTDPFVTNAVAGTVTGRILGLPDDGTGSATQVFIDSFSPDASLPYPIEVTAWFSPFEFENSFTVENGVIISALFHMDSEFSPSFDRLFINVPIDGRSTNYASVGNNNTSSIWNNLGLAGITFTRIQNPVPEPSTWAMMLLGFGAVGFALRSKRKRLVAA